MKIALATLVLAITVLISLPSTACANLLTTNPGFESGDLTGWTSGGASWVQGVEKYAGSYALGQHNADIYQDFAATTGVPYILSAWRKTTTSFPGWGDSQINLEWFDASNVRIGDKIYHQVAGPLTSWVLHSYTETAPIGVAKGRLYLGGFGGDTGDDVFADDASVAPVPEPSSILLLGSGLLGLFGVARRKR